MSHKKIVRLIWIKVKLTNGLWLSITVLSDLFMGEFFKNSKILNFKNQFLKLVVCLQNACIYNLKPFDNDNLS